MGLDPGIGTLGWAVVRQEGDVLKSLGWGAIKTYPTDTLPARLSSLYAQLQECAGAFFKENPPSAVAVEKLFFGKNIRTAEMVSQARGVVLLYASSLGAPIYEPKPAEVKLAVCGYGNAEKGQVQRMMQSLLSLSEIPKPDDAADALAIAITGLAMLLQPK